MAWMAGGGWGGQAKTVEILITTEIFYIIEIIEIIEIRLCFFNYNCFNYYDQQRHALQLFPLIQLI